MAAWVRWRRAIPLPTTCRLCTHDTAMALRRRAVREARAAARPQARAWGQALIVLAARPPGRPPNRRSTPSCAAARRPPTLARLSMAASGEHETTMKHMQGARSPVAPAMYSKHLPTLCPNHPLTQERFGSSPCRRPRAAKHLPAGAQPSPLPTACSSLPPAPAPPRCSRRAPERAAASPQLRQPRGPLQPAAARCRAAPAPAAGRAARLLVVLGAGHLLGQPLAQRGGADLGVGAAQGELLACAGRAARAGRLLS
jgi:hypothetical protein